MSEIIDFIPNRERLLKQQRLKCYSNNGVSLRDLLQGGRISMAYQPQFDLRNGEMRGVEALLRACDGQGQLLNPCDVVQRAELVGLIDLLGRFVLTKSCEEYVAIKAINPHLGRLAVNVNPLELRQPDYAESVLQTVLDTGIDLDDLELEITEGWPLDDPDLYLDQLFTLRDIGIRIALDDFGSGHANWSNVLKVPVSTVKIDRSLIEQIEHRPEAASIIKSICSGCNDMGLEPLAEGVCNKRQREALLAMGCFSAQGFGLSVPLAPEALLDIKPLNLACLSYAEVLQSR